MMLLFLPIVVLEMGAIWTALAWLCTVLHLRALVTGLILCTYPYIVTGFIHLDGYMDVTDAVKSWRDQERRREILKDSHVGSFAVIGLVLLMLAQFSLFASAPETADHLILMFIPAVSRCCSALAVTGLKPMSTSQYADRRKPKSHMVALAVMLGIFLAAEDGTACSVSEQGSGTGQPDLLWIGAAIEMRIYLIRHSKTEANEHHLYCGSTDLSLSDAGKAELHQLHYDLKNVRFLTSGMKRTNETLRILFGDVPYEEDPRFREVDFGIFEMRRYEELKDTPEYQTWLTGDNESNVPPSGESGVQMRKRVLEALADLREDTCIITHGGVIAIIMEHLFPNEDKNRYQWQPAPGMGYVVNRCSYY